MKRFLLLLLTLIVLSLVIAPNVHAQVTFPNRGGTGSTSLSGILLGNGLQPVRTLLIGANLSFDGTTLSATGGGGGGNTFGETLRLFGLAPNQYLAPTTTQGLVLQASSSISDLTVGNASTSKATTTLQYISQALSMGGDYLTDFVGAGLQVVGTTLTLDATGDWTGLFDGQQGSFYLSRSNHTGTQSTTTVTGTWGVPSGGTGSTTLSGLLKGNNTAPIQTAVGGTDYEFPLTFSAPLQRSVNTVSCVVATLSVSGCLSNTDFAVFNNKVSSTSIDTLAELETLMSGINIIQSTEIDTSSEVAGIVTDETGTGALVFATNPVLGNFTAASATIPTFNSTNTYAFNLNGRNATLTNATATNLSATKGTSTTFASSFFSALNATTTDLFATRATGTTLFSQNFTFSNATGSNLFVSRGTSTVLDTSFLTAQNATTSFLKIAALRDSASSFGSNGMVLQSNGTNATWVATGTLGLGGSGGGSVTSVDMTVPTGLSVSGNPVTTSGTLAVSLAGGYVIPLSASTTEWAKAYASTSALSASAPLVYTSNTGAFSILQSSLSQNGYLSSADFALFNNKVSSTSIDTSAELAAFVTDETGKAGSLVFSINPTFTGINAASSSITNMLAVNSTNTNATTTGTLKISSLRDSASSLGSNGMVLQSNGTVATWVATNTLGLGGAGGTTNPGGSDTQVQFNDGGVFGGDNGFLWNAASDILTLGNVNLVGTIQGQSATTGNDVGATIEIAGGNGFGSGQGGGFVLGGGGGGATGDGGAVAFAGGGGGATSGAGGSIFFEAGSADNGDSNGGSLFFTPGGSTGAGVEGTISFNDYSSGFAATFNTSLLSANRIFTFPDTAGTFCIVGVLCDGAGGGGASPFTQSTNFGALVQATTSEMWFQNGIFASSTSEFDVLDVAGNITAIKPGTTPVIAAYASNNTDYVSMYSNGGFGQIESSNTFVLSSQTGATVVSPSGPQLRVQFGNGSFRSLEITHNDTDVFFSNNATNGDYIFNTNNGGRVGIGSSTPLATLSIGGNATGTLWFGNSTSTNSTSTNVFATGIRATNATTSNLYSAGLVGIGTTSPMSLLAVQGSATIWGDNLKVGTSSPKVACFGCISMTGTDNTINGITMQTENKSAGASAYSGYLLLNDRANDAITNYAGMFLNGSNYNDNTFGTINNVPSLLQIGASGLGGISIQAATTSALGYINFATGGTDVTNERMRIDRWGRIGIGSTTPASLFSIQGSSSTSTPIFTVASSSKQVLIQTLHTGTTTISGGVAATSSMYMYSTQASKGAAIIMEDSDGAGCSEIWVLNGAISAKTVTCPTEI